MKKCPSKTLRCQAFRLCSWDNTLFTLPTKPRIAGLFTLPLQKMNFMACTLSHYTYFV